MASKGQWLVLIVIVIIIVVLMLYIGQGNKEKKHESKKTSHNRRYQKSKKCNGLCKGIPDATFGTAGVIFDLPFLYAEGVKVLSQADNKIVVIGNYTDINGSGILLSRYEMNGLLDSTFGTAGYVLYSGIAASAHGGFLQQDGKIIVVGKSNSHAIVGRYLADGNLDPGFNGGNYYEETSFLDSIAYDVKVQQNDNYLLVVGAGYETTYTNTKMLAFRLTPNGLLDSSFGGGSILVSDGAGIFTRAYNVLIDSDGKIIVAGTGSLLNKAVFMLAKFEENGTLDFNFGVDGLTFEGPPTNITANIGIDLFGAILQCDGKIVVTGQIISEGSSVVLIARFTKSGILDETFGVNGFLIDPWLDQNGSSAYGITRFCDDSFVVYGSSYNSGNGINYLLVAKYDLNGNLITTFGGMSGMDAIPQSVILDAHWNSGIIRPDGKLALTGRTMNGSFQTEIVVGVYNCRYEI